MKYEGYIASLWAQAQTLLRLIVIFRLKFPKAQLVGRLADVQAFIAFINANDSHLQ